MSRSAQQAVNDYLLSMFNDNLEGSLNDVFEQSVETPIEPQDSIPSDYRMTVGMDAFALLDSQIDDATYRFLAYLNILNLACELPHGRVKRYCLSHCQMLLTAGVVHE